MKTTHLVGKIILTVFVLFFAVVLAPFIAIDLSLFGFWTATIIIGLFVIPLVIPFIWLNKRRVYSIIYTSFIGCLVVLMITQGAINTYNEHITIDTAPNINTDKYLPFKENSKIVKTESKTLSFRDIPKKEIPVIDGATAAFPVYSAFVHALYPENTRLHNGVFEYNNTIHGYNALAEKKTDVFIGAYPSEEQIEYATECGTEFEYTQIGHEAFVFFVHKNNPVESLTLQQIKDIYSGKITNWSEVGGKNKKIVPYQRNEGSGSQSMLLRLMGNTPVMKPTTYTEVDAMGGIIEQVADYKSQTTSIGFSFRYYVEGIIKNPDIKMIAIDGVAPNADNIRNGKYPIIAPVYAVTYKDNPKPNVRKLIDWILSDEGQYIIEETGYVGMKK